MGLISYLPKKRETPILFVRSSSWENYIEKAKMLMYEETYTYQNYTVREHSMRDMNSFVEDSSHE